MPGDYGAYDAVLARLVRAADGRGAFPARDHGPVERPPVAASADARLQAPGGPLGDGRGDLGQERRARRGRPGGGGGAEAGLPDRRRQARDRAQGLSGRAPDSQGNLSGSEVAGGLMRRWGVREVRPSHSPARCRPRRAGPRAGAPSSPRPRANRTFPRGRGPTAGAVPQGDRTKRRASPGPPGPVVRIGLPGIGRAAARNCASAPTCVREMVTSCRLLAYVDFPRRSTVAFRCIWLRLVAFRCIWLRFVPFGCVSFRFVAFLRGATSHGRGCFEFARAGQYNPRASGRGRPAADTGPNDPDTRGSGERRP